MDPETAVTCTCGHFNQVVLDSSRIIIAIYIYIHAWLTDNCIKILAVHVHLLSQLTWNFYKRRYYRWQNSRR